MEGKNKLKKEIAGHGKAAQLSTYPRGIKEKDPKKIQFKNLTFHQYCGPNGGF